jgi:nitroreductase
MSDVSVHDAIFTTRAMRRLKPDPVPVADLEYVVEAATMAPSAGDFQFWGFVVVTDPEVRRRIGRAHREAGRAYIRDGMLAQSIPRTRTRLTRSWVCPAAYRQLR